MKNYLLFILFFNIYINKESSNIYNYDTLNIIPKISLVIINFYQDYLGQIKGSYCPMYPSCSNYGKEAIQNFKIKGVLMTFDRINRCSHDLKFYPTLIINESIKYYDPPSNYTKNIIN